MKKALVSFIAAVMVLAFGMVAWAETSDARVQAATSGDRQERIQGLKERARHHRLKARRHAHHMKGVELLHSDGVALRSDGTTVQVRMQRGTITAIDSHSITLKSQDGFTSTYVVDSDTVIGHEQSIEELKPDVIAKVMAIKDGDGYLAKRIRSARGKATEPKA